MVCASRKKLSLQKAKVCLLTTVTAAYTGTCRGVQSLAGGDVARHTLGHSLVLKRGLVRSKLFRMFSKTC